MFARSPSASESSTSSGSSTLHSDEPDEDEENEEYEEYFAMLHTKRSQQGGDRQDVLKWEHNATVKGRESGNSLGTPPFFLPGSGLKRVQNLPSLFTDEKYKDAVYQETVKMDGMAETIYFGTSHFNH
ncbi:hypothetical protein PG984_013212 [Apiospora sp. TS-2023a]